MKLTASGRHAATFETKGVAIHTPTTSPATARNEGSEDPRAALARALEASFPDVEIRVLQDLADGLSRRITGPELNLTDLTDDEEDVLPLMSPAAWSALQRIALADGGLGITSVILSPELSSGGQDLVDRLKHLGVEYLDVSVPADGDRIDFSDRNGDLAHGGGFRLLTLNIRPGEPGATLEHIFVPEGTMLKGSWEESMTVLAHFTDAEATVLRTARVFRDQQGELRQRPAVDLDCIQRSNESCAAFTAAVLQAFPHTSDRAASDLHAKWLKCIRGPVLDLSDCVGEEAEAVRELPQQAWEAFRADPLATGVTTLIMSHELSIDGPLLTGLNERLNAHDPRAAFIAAARAVLPDAPLGELFDKLLHRTRDTVLNLSDLSGDIAGALRCMPQSAWNEFLRHPKAADLSHVVVSPELYAGGPLVDGLSLHVHSSDERQSPDPRTAFVAEAKQLPLSFAAGRLFDELLRRARGKVLDLRRFTGDDAHDVRSLPMEAWKALLRHRRAAVLTSIKVSPELYCGGPLVPGLRLRLDLKDPRAAFVAAVSPVFPGRPVYRLFDMLVNRIENTELDFSDVEAGKEVNDLRSLPRSAWNALLKHPKAANLRSIVASDALFAGGLLVDTLMIELAPKGSPGH